MLYPLYALSEVAIVATDLAELLGSAIAICLLFPWIPLYAGVLLTGADVLVLLAMRNPLDGKPVMFFELIIAILVRTSPLLRAYTRLTRRPGLHRPHLHGRLHLQGRRPLGRGL